MLNTDHALVRRVSEDLNTSLAERLEPIDAELRGLNARRQAMEQMQEGKKAEEIGEQEKAELEAVRTDIEAQQQLRKAALSDYAHSNKVVPQLIDLALLQGGLLRGEALNAFVKRSVELI